MNALGRLSRRSITNDATYLIDWTYNTLGLPDTLTYPTSTAGVRFKVKYAYSGGYLASVQDYTGNVLGPVLWNLNLLDGVPRIWWTPDSMMLAPEVSPDVQTIERRPHSRDL